MRTVTDSNKDITVSDPIAPQRQVCLRVPSDLYEEISIAAIRRKVSAQSLWIDAARQYLGLGDPEEQKSTA